MAFMRPSRRRFLAHLCAAPLAAAVGADGTEEVEIAAPVRAITRGPRFPWFGHYEQFTADGRLVLGNEVDFEHRSPTADDVIRIGYVDLADGDRWTEFGRSQAWNWQQGCMLQWRPGHPHEAIWNDREGGRLVARVRNVRTGAERTVGAPIYAISPDGRWAVAPDFRRLNDTRPGYRYVGVPDPFATVAAPDETGIWRTDLDTDRTWLLLSFRQVAEFDPPPGGYGDRAQHWINHSGRPRNRVDPVRHLFGPGTSAANALCDAPPDAPPVRAGPAAFAAGVRRRMALRPAPARQPRRPVGVRGLAARRQRAADVPRRPRRPAGVRSSPEGEGRGDAT